MKKKYNGVVVPMVTPVTHQGRLDVASVEKIIDFFAVNGVVPLLMGTTGEGNSVSRSDGLLMVQTAVRAAKGRMLIYAGLTGNCFEEQCAQAEAYTRAGADVIVATLPTYYALTPAQMEGYYKTLADSITGPLMMYNILATTHMSIPEEVVLRLADHPRIVGLKDSERDADRLCRLAQFARNRADFAFFCGCAAFSAMTLKAGADGIVPSSGNFAPDIYVQLYQAAVTGDEEKAQRLQTLTNVIGEIYQKGRTLGESLAALKVMMQTKELCQPWMLPPLARLDEDEERSVTYQANLILSTLGIKNF